MIWNIFKRESREELQAVEVYLVDAIESFEEGQYERAATLFDVISSKYPNHPIAYLMLGRCYIELNSYSLAITAFQQHLRNYPDSTEALIYLGLTYLECGEFHQAEERFTEALCLGRGSETIQENLALTRLQAGEYESAIDDLLALHDEHPNNSEILEMLILALGRNGDWEAAKMYATKIKVSTKSD